MKLVTAESCTGGLLGTTITHREGASLIYERGFITYSNEAKTEMLGVPADLIEAKGAVSNEVAKAMAQGAIKHSKADISVSITGIAGPEGGTQEKPVGTVFLGYALKKGGSSEGMKYNFEGAREEIQTQATATALSHLISILEDL